MIATERLQHVPSVVRVTYDRPRDIARSPMVPRVTIGERTAPRITIPDVMPQVPSSEEEMKALVETINKHILTTREAFLEEERSQEKVDLTYNYEHDQKPYQTLWQYREDRSGAYEKVKGSLDKSTHFQLDTMLRERFGALSSKWKMHIKEDGLYSEFGKAEPIRNMFIRGQQYRENHGSKEVDREKAEVQGFIEVTEPYLMNPSTPENASVVVVSDPGGKGSIYNKKFYDIFTVHRNAEGERYIECRRYTSALTGRDYDPFIKELNPAYHEDESDDVQTRIVNRLRKPIIVTNPRFTSGEVIHQFIHQEHTYTSEKKMEFILKGAKPLKNGYLEQLEDDPNDVVALKRWINRILNGADDIATMYDRGESLATRPLNDEGDIIFDARALYDLGRRQTRKVMTDCGRSEGYKLSDGSDLYASSFERNFQQQMPWSVSDFGEMRAEDDPDLCRCNNSAPHFHCPGEKDGTACKQAITVGKGITRCPSCGEGKRC